MKRGICFLLAVLLICILPFGCRKDSGTDEAQGSSPLWHLGERYPSTYGTMRHAYTYEKDGQQFYLTVSRGKRSAALTNEPIEQLTRDGLTVSLYKSEKRGDETLTDYTYYECVTDAYRYSIGIEQSGLLMESLLSIDQALQLMQNPKAAIDGLLLCDEEWSAYYRLDSCSLEISVFPDDRGAHVQSCDETFSERTEDGETYLMRDSDGFIFYTNGAHSIAIRQSNRSGMEHTSYNTLTECKAILAMLGTIEEGK